jgi:hypothetical protein
MLFESTPGVDKVLMTIRARMGCKDMQSMMGRMIELTDVITLHVESGGSVLLTHPTLGDRTLVYDKDQQDDGPECSRGGDGSCSLN